VLYTVGFGVPPIDKQWIRIVMNGAVGEHLAALAPDTQEAVEIGGRNHEQRPWKSYSALDFPSFDLCNPPADLPQFDVVLCEQVLEHLPDPWRAVRTLHDLAKSGGHIVVSTPFLYRIHPVPEDYWRFTRDGMSVLLESAGLRVLTVGSWGNRSAVRAVFRRDPALRFWRSLRNDPSLPIQVWAIAQRPAVAPHPTPVDVTL
jgi:SAM-dependent methyltransferase